MTTLTAKPCKKLTKPCKKCGGVDATNRGGECKQCANNRYKEWVKNNRERSNLSARIYRSKNTEKFNHYRIKNIEYHRKYNIENREKSTASRKEWVKNNPFSNACVVVAIRYLKTARLFNIKSADLPEELIEIKRLQMQLHHAIKARQQLEIEHESK